MLHTNSDKLVKLSVMGEIDHPTLRKGGYVINHSGGVQVFPSVGGITYNYRIGQNAVDLPADHVEPGVSIVNSGNSRGEYSTNAALNVLACIGNRVKVVSGEAKGAIGYVTGKHGGIEHVMVDFEPEILEKLVIGDKMQIQSRGVGLKLTAFPTVNLFNLDPSLMQKIFSEKNGKLLVKVTHQIPAQLMGAGLGSSSAHSGDYDIQLFDPPSIEKYSLNSLRFGDVVAIIGSDASHGWIYLEDAITIGVIAHSNSVISGHGPGVTTIASGKQADILPEVTKTANLFHLLYEEK